MLREIRARTLTHNFTAKRSFERRAKRLLHRLAIHGLHLHRHMFLIRVVYTLSGSHIAVCLQSRRWYVAVSAPHPGRRPQVSYVISGNQTSRMEWWLGRAHIDSLLDVRRFARQLRANTRTRAEDPEPPRSWVGSI